MTFCLTAGVDQAAADHFTAEGPLCKSDQYNYTESFSRIQLIFFALLRGREIAPLEGFVVRNKARVAARNMAMSRQQKRYSVSSLEVEIKVF